MTWFLQTARGVFFFVFVFSLLLITNVLQMLSLLILPLSKRVFRSVNRFCAAAWWGLCVLCAEYFYGAKLKLSGDELPIEENAIVVVNHQDMSDIFLVMMLALSRHRIGDLKFFVKDILKYVPGVGWGMLFLDCIFVKRNWEADKSKIESTFSKFHKEEIPIWLISYVEGTRFSKEKMRRSQEFARSRDLPILTNVLIPRTKGFVASIAGLSDHVTAIYDLTIGHQRVPTLWEIFTGRAREFSMHVRRYELSEIPTQAAKQSDWLIDRFLEKDALLSKFKERNSFT